MGRSKPSTEKVSNKKKRKSTPELGTSSINPIPVKIIFSAVVVALVAFVSFCVYLGYLETRIYTPLAEEKVLQKTGIEVPDRFWGSYRPGVYFGLKHRSQQSVVFGLMWLLPSQVRPGYPGLRHLCLQSDNLPRYGWIEHDGINFGVQEILDHNFKITTSFVKRPGGINGGEWTARISAEPKLLSEDPHDVHDEIVLLAYIALEPGLAGELEAERSSGHVSYLQGNTSDLGSFNIRFLNGNGVLAASNMQTRVRSVNDVSMVALENMISKRSHGKWLYSLKNKEIDNSDSNLFVRQVHTKGSFTMDVVFESDSFFNRPFVLAGDNYSDILQSHRDQFYKKFENTFHLRKNQFNSTSIKFAQATLSNLIGGIGYFHGTSRVQSIYNKTPVPYWSASLLTSVPSRSFFPRGFLWDEGFHLLLVNKWNPEISIDIISHWLDLMNTEGWIPREQILGDEALSRVPEEFVVQRNNVANPPTLILALHDLLERHRDWLLINHKSTLYRMWPRLTMWYNWLNRTQSGDLPSTFRWRGRNSTTTRELNPKTLASGLDDYPRASHPSELERHLDLRCWMAFSSRLMGELAQMLSYDASKYISAYNFLSDPSMLDSLHWSDELQGYADYGLHSDHVILKYVLSDQVVARQQHGKPQEKSRIDITPPKYGFVNVFGYISLFPLLAQILEADSEKLLITLQNLEDPKLVWTDFGIRSLASNNPLYNARNTEHDPPYWRGPIWININFLTLKSLKYYSGFKGSVGTKAADIYKKLRTNVIENIIRQYNKTGYVWEQYDDTTGIGKGCKPFTGWSALVVLIMAEEY